MDRIGSVAVSSRQATIATASGSVTTAAPASASARWQRELRDAIRRPEELLALLQLEPEQLDWAVADGGDFPLRVPRHFAARMRTGDPADPLLRQVLSSRREWDSVTGFSTDPLAESAANPCPGLLHKYRGRALLLATHSCAVHCRYCFRRHFPQVAGAPGAHWQAALDYIAAHQEIGEVILSGGDPLMLRDTLLAKLCSALEAIPHLRGLRLHTRLPVVIPARITEALLERLATSRLRTTMVVHINHAQELDDDVAAALRRVGKRGIALLNQSVLLRGVNDEVKVLTELSEALHYQAGTLPYYLHLPDRVANTAHFYVNAAEGRRLMAQLRANLPGYLVPRLVREEAGGSAKTIIAA